MKSLFTNFWQSCLNITAIECLLPLLLQIFYWPHFSIRALFDGMTIVSLSGLCAGLLLFVFQSGFFDSTIYSFKRFARALRKARLGEQDPEAPLAELKHRDGKKRPPFTWALLASSSVLFLITLASALF